MDRRQFLGSAAVAGLTASLSADANVSAEDHITAGVITNAGGAHLGIYFEALAKVDEVRAVVLADADGASETMARNALGEKLTKVYTDRDAMLATEKPAMAVVSLEAKLSPEAIRATLLSGCHVFAEKPACIHDTEFETLVKLADSSNLLLMLALVNRVNPEVVEARRIVEAGLIGKIYGVEMNLIQDQTRLTNPGYQASWMASKARAGGGHLSWLGIHWLDLAMYITGSRIEQVAGFSGNVGGQPLDTEDSVAMTMKFDKGFFGTLTSGYYLDKGYQSHLKIWGSKGWLQIDSDPPRRMRWYSSEAGQEPGMKEFIGPEEFDPYIIFMRNAVRASLRLEHAPISGADSLHVLRTVHGLYKAASTESTQQISAV
ncbi:MAG TPA: Gfo/Idh/MocA family oxidoreductase [Candidatus Hydrogenedentes bacterium]|nr:Gfo/Idh/MocA family oxidoreductase [Candidatus Hydrogenedentota bacterium]